MYTDPWGRTHRYPPPVGWTPPPNGVQVNFNAGEQWASMVKQGLSFPEYRGPYGPSSWRGVRGDCLEPLVTSQHTLRVRPVAPDEPLIDGGLYEIELGASESSAKAVAYREKHGMAPGERFVIAKFLRYICYEWYVQCKDCVSPLNEHGPVLTMIVAISPLAGCAPPQVVHARQAACGNPFDAASSECSDIRDNAATQIIINNNNSSGSGISGVTGLISTGVVVSNAGPSVDCTVIVTATIQARQTAGTLGDVKLLVRYRDDGVTMVSSAQELKIVSASFQSYTLQWQFAHSQANSGVSGQASIWSDSGSTSDSYDWQLATLQMEYVLR